MLKKTFVNVHDDELLNLKSSLFVKFLGKKNYKKVKL